MTGVIPDWVFPLIIVLPLLLAFAVWVGCVQAWVIRFSVIAPLPALCVSLVSIASGSPVTTVDLTWILNGGQLLLDKTSQVFLLLTAIVWLSSALLSLAETSVMQLRPRYYFSFLLAMAANMGVVLAGELTLFYTCFAVMSFSAYGLIVTNDDASTERAGRIYITLVVIGEILLFPAFVVIAQNNGSSLIMQWQTLAPVAMAVPLLVLGFGVKVGVIPWHFVLPITYRVAPTSATVALGGAMLNAGLLGWYRFLPLGQTSLPDTGAVIVVFGLIAAFAGAFIGIMQKNPKALLGYSSISQVGLMTVMVGLILVDQGTWETISAVLLIYVLHHALAKGALFYAIAVPPSRRSLTYYWQCIALLLPALSVAGAPLTTGSLAKVNFKTVIGTVQEPWSSWLNILLPISSIITALLLIRFAVLVWPKRSSESAGNQFSSVIIGQSILILAVVCCTWFVAYAMGLGALSLPVKSEYLWASTWPLLLAGVIAMIVNRMLKSTHRHLPRIPTGDVLLPLETIIHHTLTYISKLTIWIGRIYQQSISRLPDMVVPNSILSTEYLFRTPIAVGILFTLIFIGILTALIVP